MANLAGVDWNLFLVLHTVLEEGSATKAAKRLHVTQSAVSNALARLRGVIGDPLVVRIGNQLVPTAKARELAPRIALVVAQLEHVLSPAAAFDPATTDRTFTLATQEALAFVPELCVQFVTRFPRARLRVVAAHDPGPGLAVGEIDALVGVVDPVPAGCVAEELYEEQLVTVSRTKARPGALRIVVQDTGDSQLAVPTFAAALAVVARTDAVLVCPKRVATTLAGSLQVAPHAAEPISVSLVWHARSDADPAAFAFRDLVRGLAAAG